MAPDINPELVDEIEAKARAALPTYSNAAYVALMVPPTTIALVTAYRNALARIAELEAAAERAERDRDALVEAIEPFSRYAIAVEPGDWASGDGWCAEQIIGGIRHCLTVGDLRRAARVLEQVRGKA